MAVNPTTGIDPVVDRFVIWKVSTSQFINMNASWIRFDGGPIDPPNPDLQYFKKVSGTPPDGDHRFTMTTEYGKVPIVPAPAAGLPQGTYEAQYTLTKLSTADLKAQVDTEFQKQVRSQFPAVEDPSRLLLAAGALARKQDGATLTADQEAIIDAVKVNEDSIKQIEARRQALYAAIDADEDYDITDGWT